MSEVPVPQAISHQTIRLSRGDHGRPEDGACVMELSSMLAGERFSDHPKSVCRVIASFLRAYNDAVDDERRQDLYRCAADVVGTRRPGATERARVARCEREYAELRGRAVPKAWRWLTHGLRALHPAGNFFARLARTLATSDGGHRRALALVDDLVAIDVPPTPPCRAMSGEPAVPGGAGRPVGSRSPR